ncbi:tRNA pseudouridine(55) synthase TruB [Thermodesulfobacterium sp. TA1]|uniref:tRNA pseudouridine(55) synthase TruB n=1 Tax=Thermodesulfobacterium sp. TA1 TaxID=2234087 RepID=UPI001232A8F8|nr:tRNA pseudouridine(55) synthase TruB [Thermodesulfobacterium sp. TA1]QER42046.1 tRNA pseudouridine(55) synthase TruB [Thermodesulfobacterium sp. TA1]
MRKDNQLNGILVVDKPEGLTSTQTLEKVKKILKIKKAGHGGTLDPIATGVLPILLGKATKVAQIFLEGDKVYQGEMQLGISTLTFDITGEVVAQKPIPDFSLEDLKKGAQTFLGEIDQIPPPFSAAKFRGKPLYKYARDGLLIPKEPKKVKVFRFEILDITLPYVKFEIHCSKGTYIRSIVNSFGERLECGATLTKLRRLKKSIFTIEEALTLEEISRLVQEDYEGLVKRIIPVEKSLEFLPKILVSEDFSQRIQEGRPMHTSSFLSFIKFQKLTLSPYHEWIRILNPKGKLVAIIENPLKNLSNEYIKYFRVFKD